MFLAYASYMGFMVYQMDVKSAFHCMGQLKEGKIDQTLFIKMTKGTYLLVKYIVDDISLDIQKRSYVMIEKLKKDKFQMSSMGELTFFLGLQIQQKKKGIFISQDKYVNEILRKFNYTDVKSASTPTDLEKPLVQDGDAADVDEHLYRSMIGSLIVTLSIQPYIMFAVCALQGFQVSPKTSHLLAVKRIFRYLKGKPSLGLWYSKDSPLELVAYTDSDYAGATQDRKSTTGGCQFLGNRLISWQCKKQTISISPLTTELNMWLLQVAVDSLEFMKVQKGAAFLEKSTGSEGFHQVIDFLSQSHISYALTKKPDIYISFIKQFWRTAEASTDTDGEVTITAIIDGQSKTITEASLRRHLKLEDHDGITSIPNSEIFEQLALMGYQPDSDKLTFQKGVFSPQWRFLIHTLLHCISPKKTAWEQFSSNIATALICLATNRKYNFSRLIFEHMVTNIGSPHKFLMYPRFIQICLDMQKKQLKTHSKTYPVPSLNNKVFSNMRRLTKGYTGVEIRLFPTMLPSPPPEPSPTPSSSPSRITSSPSPSSEPSTAPTFEPQPSPDAEYHVPTPNESPLHAVHSHGSDEGSLKLNELTNLVTKLSERIGVLEDDLKKTKHTYSSAFTKLILRIKKLEATVKTGKARKRARVVLSEDEEDDSSKQGRIDEDPNIYFAQDDEVVHDQDTAFFFFFLKKKDDKKNSIAGITVSTAPINISTARESHSTAGRVVYGRRSKEARKDKGKEIMTEPEPVKKSKKLLEQERLGLEEAIRLQEKIDEEERAQVARDEEIARQLLALDEERVTTETKTTRLKQIEKDTTGKRKKSLPRKRNQSTDKETEGGTTMMRRRMIGGKGGKRKEGEEREISKDI
ncbi:uncharacterized mitochondrial protein-like protein [Tanacetum coccineum]